LVVGSAQPDSGLVLSIFIGVVCKTLSCVCGFHLFFGGTGVELTLAKQALYHLSHTPIPFCFVF
jgi:hypothetical protein